jgi:hypothetical protein
MSSEKKKIVKCVRDGKVAVLISPGFGAGWSTWSGEFRDFLLFDEGLVLLAEKGATGHEVETYLEQQLGAEAYVYTGGWPDIKVEWLAEGTHFTVEEYDGSESLRLIEDLAIIA